MSRHRRGRITVQAQPTGAARAVRRMAGVVQAVFGLVFVVLAVTEIIPAAGLIGLPFLAAGGLFAVVGILTACGKNSLPRRVGYDVETGIEEKTIVGLLDDADSGKQPEQAAPASSGDAIRPSAKTRLEQLQALKTAGLITCEEYEQKRLEILRAL
ncbi:MAG: SHOCT domain-containing protein [Lawsonibacter sp.]|nr:SHOCT domain-containing protein [Lawsonibacter sp.]